MKVKNKCNTDVPKFLNDVVAVKLSINLNNIIKNYDKNM